MAENKVGRPTVMTKEVLSKLEMLFAHGLTDREACLIANISPASLYDYCVANPEFGERKEMLKDKPKIQAKLNISEEINKGDRDTSKWYLERKAKDEFSTKQEISGDIKVAKLEDLL